MDVLRIDDVLRDGPLQAPWIRSRLGFQVLTHDGRSVCAVSITGVVESQRTVADLLAAAPNLLDICKEVAEQECGCADNVEQVWDSPHTSHGSFAPCLSCRARAALATARGEE